jgi:hypothetical protein
MDAGELPAPSLLRYELGAPFVLAYLPTARWPLGGASEADTERRDPAQ